jgi:glycosyltransferase involved in cell wall biosynthesis
MSPDDRGQGAAGARGLSSTTWPQPGVRLVPEAELPPQPDPGRVKLLHVITRLAGGSGGNTTLSALGMSRERYDVWVAGGDGGPYWDELDRQGLHVVRLRRMRETISPLDDLLTLRQLVRLMRRERFSVVHTHSAKAGLLARIAARLTHVPVVVHTFHAFAAHEFLSRRRRIAYLFLDRVVRRLAHQYVAVAPRVARQAVETRLAPAGSVVVVPSAVEAPRVGPGDADAVRRELGIPPHARVVGTVGRIVHQKAPLDFVRMAAAVRRSYPDTVFVMVGDASLECAPLEEETKAEARRLGVDILFTGFRDDAPRLAAAFDVFVISSLHEGLGRALTEAMAVGCPVVATAVNGVPDLVEPGATGLLARPADPDGLAECVEWMLRHPEAAKAMGAQARERVRSMFEPAVMCEMLDAVYSRWLGLPGTAASSVAEIDLTVRAQPVNGHSAASSLVVPT